MLIQILRRALGNTILNEERFDILEGIPLGLQFVEIFEEEFLPPRVVTKQFLHGEFGNVVLGNEGFDISNDPGVLFLLRLLFIQVFEEEGFPPGVDLEELVRSHDDVLVERDERSNGVDLVLLGFHLVEISEERVFPSLVGLEQIVGADGGDAGLCDEGSDGGLLVLLGLHLSEVFEQYVFSSRVCLHDFLCALRSIHLRQKLPNRIHPPLLLLLHPFSSLQIPQQDVLPSLVLVEELVLGDLRRDVGNVLDEGSDGRSHGMLFGLQVFGNGGMVGVEPFEEGFVALAGGSGAGGGGGGGESGGGWSGYDAHCCCISGAFRWRYGSVPRME
mmetsp:Transcript_28521/g.48543  ORF Transcript_28521/g.48543 Transcript_28521/m.48543 type:complete len:331 (+) Transcript_28521:788-1780(+)